MTVPLSKKPEFGMVLFLQDPTVEEVDKTNVGWQKWMD
jgi:hypothetical protein